MSEEKKKRGRPKKQENEKPNVGRPTSFKPEYVKQAKNLALLGLSEEQMRSVFDVAMSTFSLWKVNYPEFSDALKEGKQDADGKVAASLYKRAIGFKQKENDIRTVSLPDGQGSEVVITEYEKTYPPEVTACIFWLKNRQKELWRANPENESKDKQESKSGIPVVIIKMPDNANDNKPD
jgi:hypothetical protein